MTSPSPDPLAEFPVVIALPVLWGDQDAFGHVNNTVLFRWFESARIAYGERLGLDRMFETERQGPILAAIGCNFRKQIRYPDTVRVGARITKVGRTSFTMAHAALGESAGGIVADGESVIVLFDYAGQRPVPLPDELVRQAEALERRPLRPSRRGGVEIGI
ncbi:MAG: thioesterase family protein [Planctomycetales bacterium]